MNEYKGANICRPATSQSMLNYAISGTEFCGFDVLDLSAVLTALKVAAAMLLGGV